MKTLKDKEMFVQCSLQKRQGVSLVHRIIWANCDKAVVGNTVKVEEDNGTWTDGWEVMEVYGSPLPESTVRHRSHDHTRQRPSSDI